MACDMKKYYYECGEQQGRVEGMKIKTLQHIKNVMEEFNVDIYKAMRILRVPSSEYEYYLSLI